MKEMGTVMRYMVSKLIAAVRTSGLLGTKALVSAGCLPCVICKLDELAADLLVPAVSSKMLPA
ncbi:hypothetical protein L3i20_v223290 [Paenibacillus sp. L3-i20]|nr:hypothetical protein L3i20_v223290 [Paenibacillus sp. L3-i20]